MAIGFARISALWRALRRGVVSVNKLKSLKNLFCPFVHGVPREGGQRAILLLWHTTPRTIGQKPLFRYKPLILLKKLCPNICPMS